MKRLYYTMIIDYSSPLHEPPVLAQGALVEVGTSSLGGTAVATY
jgi:hypothetical protein